jgi:hypothetical protein
MIQPKSITSSFWNLFYVVGICLLVCSCKSEPKYKGKNLETWMRGYNTGGEARQSETEVAVRAMGTNALPVLTRWLAEISGEYLYAPTAFGLLGEAAAPAVPELEQLMRSTNELTSILAAQSLGQIGKPALPVFLAALTNTNDKISSDAALCITDLGTNARPAIPIFLSQLQHPNGKVRARAAVALGNLELEPDSVVPALTPLLKDPIRLVRYLTIQAIGEFGTNAQSALPLLTPLLSDANEGIRNAATNAVQAIDPKGKL